MRWEATSADLPAPSATSAGLQPRQSTCDVSRPSCTASDISRPTTPATLPSLPATSADLQRRQPTYNDVSRPSCTVRSAMSADPQRPQPNCNDVSRPSCTVSDVSRPICRGAKASLSIRKHDHFTPARKTRRDARAVTARNHPEGRFYPAPPATTFHVCSRAPLQHIIDSGLVGSTNFCSSHRRKGSARADDALGAPTQNHISPVIL